MALAKRNEGAKVNSNINVTPMVDVMLVLLIIFMVITPMLQKGVSVDMAKVNNPTPMPDADKEDALAGLGYARRQNLLRHRRGYGRLPDSKGEGPAGESGGQTGLHQVRCARQVRQCGGRGGQRTFGRESTMLDLLTEQNKTATADKHAAHRRVRARLAIGVFHGNDDGRSGGGPIGGHQRDAADRCVAGAADHLHGHHAAHAERVWMHWFRSLPKISRNSRSRTTAPSSFSS